MPTEACVLALAAGSRPWLLLDPARGVFWLAIEPVFAQAIGEACPHYIVSRIAARRIRSELPHVKLIASLRQPADRAFSDYVGTVRNGVERRPVEQVLQSGNDVVARGFYCEQLRRYYDLFDESDIKIVLFDDIVAAPQQVLGGIFAFLGVDRRFVPNTAVRHSAGAYPRSLALNEALFKIGRVQSLRAVTPPVLRRLWNMLHRSTMVTPPRFPDQLRRQLTDHYREDITRLQDLLGRDLSPWLS